MKNDVSAIPAGKSNYLKRLLFLLVCVLMSGNAVWAQQPTITIHAKNQSLKEVLKEIEQQSKHSFIYSSSTINVNQKVNLECNGVSLDKALEQLGAIADITYSISNHQIMLAPAGKQPTPAAVAGNQKGAKAGQTIRGVVKDENGDPIVGASVFFKGTTVGVATDVDGKFTLKTTEAGQLLVASFIGYSNAEVKVMPNQEVYNFDLKPESKMIEEVIVTGYQTISKERATGSFAIISPKDMEGKLQTNVMDRLEGKVAGLTSNRGNIQIRGVSTLNGDKTPLYVVDGIPFEGEPGSQTTPLDVLNPSDVVNITVLKDATAASIYGARSANGVIVITTRSGSTGKPRVNYNGSIKLQGLPDRDYANKMSSSELVDFQKMLIQTFPNVNRYDANRFQNDVQLLLLDWRDGKLSESELETKLKPYRTHDRYNQVIDEFLRKRAITHQHNLSFNGGSDIYKYNFSINYTGTAPYEREQKTKRIGFNIKNTFNLFKWFTLDAGIIGSNKSEDYDNGVLGMNLLNAGTSSYYMLRDDEGNPPQMYNTKSQAEIDRLKSIGLMDETYIPVNEMASRHYTAKSRYLNLNFGAKFKIIDGLNLELRYQTENTTGFTKQYDTKNALDVKTMINDAAVLNPNGTLKYNIPVGGQIVQTNTDNNSYTMRAQVNYNNTFSERHDLQVLVGAERRKVVTSQNGFYRLGYDDQTLVYSEINALDLNQMLRGTQSIYGTFSFNNKTPGFSHVDNRYVSFYGNASYTLDNRLTVNGSIRIDQSNLFGTDPKYQYKPLWSVGAHYVLFQNKTNWLDRLVLRATYGINGNVSKKNGPYLIAAADRNNYYTNESAFYIKSPANPSLRWEKTQVTNIAVDFNLFQNRLNGSVEFYNKKSSDLLGDFSTDPTLGWSSMLMNFASLYNRGVEIVLNSENIKTNEFSWTSNFIFGYNKNKVLEVETSDESAYSYYSKLNTRKNYAMNSMFSVRYAGLDENGIPTAYNKNGEIVKSADLLTKEDLVYSGTYEPRFNASFTNRLSYKGFDLSFMFIYAGGHVMRDVKAGMLIAQHPIYRTSNADRDLMNYWKSAEDNNNPDINPAFAFQNQAAMKAKDLWSAADKHVQKGDYIKLRDVTLGYTIPPHLLKKYMIQGIRLNVQVQNLWYWAANRDNLDPEVWNGSSLSPSRGSHLPANVTFGLSVNF